MSSLSNKKPKTSQEEQSEFEQVRRYVLDCPFVRSDHAAIKAALAGIDQEIKRRERDEKLRMKFMQDAVTVERPKATNEGCGGQAGNVCTTDEKKSEIVNDDEVMTDDWHDIAKDSTKDDEEDAGLLGETLSKEAINSIAQSGVRVQTPLAAVAVALHAAMRSETLGFACTGIPEEGSSASKGFAPPVRELPKTTFLPSKWDEKPDLVSLRYRKNSTGSVILKVGRKEPGSPGDIVVEVSLYPSTSTEPSNSLVFPLNEHVNLDSFARAIKEQKMVAPALHYKSLSNLLTNFAATFDLGNVAEEKSQEEALPYVDVTVQNLRAQTQQPTSSTAAFVKNSMYSQEPDNLYPTVIDPMRNQVPHPTIDNAFPPGRFAHPPGDFADDLVPGGITGPHFGRVGPNMGGNLMGPNHPMFHGGGMGGVGPNSGYGMRPRYDPINGPPGGPTEPDGPFNDGNRRGQRPGGPGEPNPDHLRKPNNLGGGSMGNMFM